MEGEVGLHPAIVMFALCDNMKWNHLPVTGGVYAQDPDFVEKIQYIFGKRNAKLAKEQEEQQKKIEQQRRTTTSPMKSARRPRRH